MFGSTIIDIAIGLVFTFLVVSIAASAITESIASAIKWRSKTLKEGIKDLLNDSSKDLSGLALQIYNHALVNPRANGTATANSPPPDKKLPAYVYPEHFAQALLDVTGITGKAGQDMIMQEVNKIQDDQIKTLLTGIVDRTSGNMAAISDGIAHWFDAAMDRVSVVESLRHPGGNVTGIAGLVPQDFIGKELQLLKDVVPNASRMAVLIDPTMSAHRLELPKLPEDGRRLGVKLITIEAIKADQYEAAFETAHAQDAEAILVFNGPLPIVHSAEIAKLAARYRLPAIYLERRYVEDGGLLSYGMNSADIFRRAGAYVDKILKGEKPGDIPVEQPTRFELIVNLKTAKALGITVPSSILAQADEVIE